MTVREALEKYQLSNGMNEFWIKIDILAPKIEAALRETAESMENYYLSCGVPHNRKRSRTAMEKCVTAGIEKLGEET